MNLSISNDKKAEILNDHYKDTCLRLAGYRKQRNRLVFYASITIITTLFLQIFPTETLRIVASIFLRTAADNAIKITNDLNYGAILLAGFILMSIAITYKHYRIAMNNQFTYVQMLESELNSLYPKSNLFNRETDFSSKESLDFAMWNSRMYSKMLKGGCLFLVVTYVILCKGNIYEKNVSEAIVTGYGCLMSLLSFAFFATQKPLTYANLVRVLTLSREK